MTNASDGLLPAFENGSAVAARTGVSEKQVNIWSTLLTKETAGPYGHTYYIQSDQFPVQGFVNAAAVAARTGVSELQVII